MRKLNIASTVNSLALAACLAILAVAAVSSAQAATTDRLTFDSPTYHVGVRAAFSMTLTATNAAGRPISGFRVNVTADCPPNKACLGWNYDLANITDANGTVTIHFTANGVPGEVTVYGMGENNVILDEAVVAVDAEFKFYQGMFWAGPAENGWGLSFVQHRDTLFGALYIYDSNGKPTWLVLPGAAWDSTHTIAYGPLYTPGGTPYFAYDASRLQVGSRVGDIAIVFPDQYTALLSYTIGGIKGSKTVKREIFATGPVVTPDRTDLWWGGSAQNGWGISVMQQASTLLSVWFTYDANGVATWYVMPGGTWTATDVYEGRVYRTTGDPWVGARYDQADLQVFDAGTYRFQFNGDSATLAYTVDGHTGTLPLVREPF